MNHQNMYEQYAEQLKQFRNIRWVDHALTLKEKPNFWTINEYGKMTNGLQRSAHETRISKMFRWLLDPNENHRLGNVFAEQLIRHLGGTYASGRHEHVTAVNEYQHIDVLYQDHDQRVVVAIELKQYAKEGISKEGESQLDRYERVVERLAHSMGATAHYVYITALKERPTNDRWIAVGYEEVIAILDTIIEQHIHQSALPYRADTEKIVRDFKDELQRSADIANGDNRAQIDAQLSPEQKKLTSLLAIELEGGKEMPHYEALKRVIQDEQFPLKELIMLTKQCSAVQVQDHTPNDAVRMLIRHIYNELSEDQQLDLDVTIDYSAEERLSNFRQDLRAQYGLGVETIELTSGKGQGLHIKPKNQQYRIYLSGDGKGNFPNDYVHLVREVNGRKERVNAEALPNRQFHVTSQSVMDGGVLDKDGNFVSFDRLIERYVVPALRELDERAAQWEEEERQ